MAAESEIAGVSLVAGPWVGQPEGEHATREFVLSNDSKESIFFESHDADLKTADVFSGWEVLMDAGWQDCNGPVYENGSEMYFANTGFVTLCEVPPGSSKHFQEVVYKSRFRHGTQNRLRIRVVTERTSVADVATGKRVWSDGVTWPF